MTPYNVMINPVIFEANDRRFPDEVRLVEPPNGEKCRSLTYIPERTTTRDGKHKTKYGRSVPLCEHCDYAIGDDRYNFCPKCGARIV